MNEKYAGKWVRIKCHKDCEYILHIKKFHYEEPQMYAICHKEIHITNIDSGLTYYKFDNTNVHDLDEKNITIIDINEVKQTINNMLDKTVKQYQKKFNRL